MTLVVSGFAKLYSYFKHGAEKTDIISKAQNESSIHDPTYTWDNSETVEGVELDEFTRSEIQQAYTLAWYILNTSLAKQEDLGIADRFSKKMVPKITNGLKKNNSTSSERAELNHNIKVHLFSYDRQLISFTDTDVNVITKTTNLETGVSNQVRDSFDFDVVMGLEDGYWKIFEIIQLKSDKGNLKNYVQAENRIPITKNIKGINYYPSEDPWFDFWKNYNSETVAQDIKLMKRYGFNHTRIFIPYALFGKGSLDSLMVFRLDDFLDQCKKQDITTTISLFDFPESYKLAYYPATRQHLLQLLKRYYNHPAVQIWDLKNEADLDFENYTKEVVVSWLDFIIEEAKNKYPNSNLTVGWSKIDYIEILADKLDLQSFHLYGDLKEHQKYLRKLKKEKKIIKPLYLSEFGMTSYQSKLLPFGSTKKQQAVFTQNALQFIAEEEINHYAFWTLHDFQKAPKEVIGWKPWIRKAQKNMGLLSTDGKEKPVLANFLEGDQEVEGLSWYQKIHPISMIIPFLLFTLLLITNKSKI